MDIDFAKIGRDFCRMLTIPEADEVMRADVALFLAEFSLPEDMPGGLLAATNTAWTGFRAQLDVRHAIRRVSLLAATVAPFETELSAEAGC